MELHISAQDEAIGLAVLCNIPAVCEIGDYCFAAVTRVTPYQVVEHAGLGAQIVECPRLMDIEMWLAAGERYSQHAAALGIRLHRGEPEFGAIELVRHALSQANIWQKAEGSSGCGRAAL